MSVAQPDILLVFDETSGKTITQYGTNASAYTINAATVENTDFSWHTNSPGLAYVESETVNGDQMFYATTAATTPGTTLETINCAMKVRVDLHHVALGYSWVIGGGVNTFTIYALSPAGSGDFDFEIHVGNNLGQGRITISGGVWAAKSYGVDYIISFSVDTSSITVVQARAKLDSNSVTEPATENWTGGSYAEDMWPTLFADHTQFTNNGGTSGRLYWFAYQKGGTAWSASDLADINSDPATITGWPGGVTNVAPVPTGVAATSAAGALATFGRPAPPYTLTTITG